MDEECLVPWCDGECAWEYETDDLPEFIPVGDEVAEAEYLHDYGHPPFRWHSTMWPSGVVLEQNEFPPHTDPAYVAENGRLIITGVFPGPGGPDQQWTKDDPPTPKVLAQLPPHVAADITSAAAIARNEPDRLIVTSGPDHLPGPSDGRACDR
jgi:hypothetical protein